MGIPNSMIIAMSDIDKKIDAEAPIKDRLKQAMKLAQNHWLVTNEDEQFRSAIGAVMATASPEEKRIIMREIDFLKGLGAAIEGVPVDVVELLTRRPKNAYGLRGLWSEAKMAEAVNE